jgi:tripartite-type tricarboxylate transporter receptor subunit TctC
MRTLSKLLALAAFAAASLAAPSAFAQAQSWPAKPVRWIVPFSPGGPADVLARTVAQKLSLKWGQQVLVDNKPGAYTLIGAVEAARAAPDGYTLFQPIDNTLTMNPYMFSKLPYDPIKDFTHITQLAGLPLALIANDHLPARNVAEVIALAKAKPGTVPFGASTPTTQVGIEKFSRDARIKVMSVTYKGSADVTKAMLSGEIQASIDGLAPYMGLIKQGKLRVLAISGAQRNPALPDVPTFSEVGLKNSDQRVWNGLSAPAGLPNEIRARILADVQAVLAMPEVKERLNAAGLDPVGSSSEEFVALVQRESAVMGPLIKQLGLKFD